MYKTYPLKESLKGLKDEDVVIASKSDYKRMETVHSFKGNGQKLYRYISPSFSEIYDNKEKAEALKCLLDCKAKGLIKAVGISSHNVKVVEKAADIDVVNLALE